MRRNSTELRYHWRSLAAGLVLVMLGVGAGQTTSLSFQGNFQESSNKTSTAPPTATACNSTVFCYIEFAKVPAGKQLIVTQVSCALSVSNGNAQAVSMTLSPRRPNGNAVERFQMLIPSTMPSNQPGYNLVLNSNAYQLFGSGDRPEIHVLLNAAANIIGFCSISGQLFDAL